MGEVHAPLRAVTSPAWIAPSVTSPMNLAPDRDPASCVGCPGLIRVWTFRARNVALRVSSMLTFLDRNQVVPIAA